MGYAVNGVTAPEKNEMFFFAVIGVKSSRRTGYTRWVFTEESL